MRTRCGHRFLKDGGDAIGQEALHSLVMKTTWSDRSLSLDQPLSETSPGRSSALPSFSDNDSLPHRTSTHHHSTGLVPHSLSLPKPNSPRTQLSENTRSKTELQHEQDLRLTPPPRALFLLIYRQDRRLLRQLLLPLASAIHHCCPTPSDHRGTCGGIGQRCW